MLAAGLLAKKAVERGLHDQAWVKTASRPGSKVVTEYLTRGRADAVPRAARFNLVGYGCTTCIGNTGPLPDDDLRGDRRARPGGRRVLSRQPQLRGPHQPEVRANYLASPPLVVAYALAGTHGHRPRQRAARHGHGRQAGLPARTSGRRRRRSTRRWSRSRHAEMFQKRVRARSSRATSAGGRCTCPKGDLFAWDRAVDLRQATRPTSRACRPSPAPVQRRSRARACWPCSATAITTDHISPAGSIKEDGPAGQVPDRARRRGRRTSTRYGARRGNHEVMVRGTFANVRLRNSWRPAPRAASPATCPTAS